MSTRETYTVVRLSNSSNCELIIPNGADYSRAMYKYSQQKAYDLSIFLMEQICRIDEESMDVSYYAGLGCDDYLKITEAINHLLTPIR